MIKSAIFSLCNTDNCNVPYPEALDVIEDVELLPALGKIDDVVVQMVGVPNVNEGQVLQDETAETTDDIYSHNPLTETRQTTFILTILSTNFLQSSSRLMGTNFCHSFSE